MNTVQESDQVVQRRANLEELKKLGVEPYPRRFEIEASVDAIVAEHGSKTAEALEAAQPRTRTAGRILPAAQPQIEFTITMTVPWVFFRTSSTSPAVRSSCTPRRVSSSRIGRTISSGYAIGTSKP